MRLAPNVAQHQDIAKAKTTAKAHQGSTEHLEANELVRMRGYRSRQRHILSGGHLPVQLSNDLAHTLSDDPAHSPSDTLHYSELGCERSRHGIMILLVHETRARPLEEDRALHSRPTRHMNITYPVSTHLVHDRALATVLLLVHLGHPVRLAVDIVHLRAGPVTRVLGGLRTDFLGTLRAFDHSVRTALGGAVLVLDGGVGAESALGMADGVGELASVGENAAHLVLGCRATCLSVAGMRASRTGISLGPAMRPPSLWN
jgi:hypothetical protein